jgi:hypothetical protein
LWDIDGNGLSKIENPETARAILRKVNAMNVQTAFLCGIPAAFFALLSQQQSVTLVLWSLFFAALYIGRDRVPKDL